MLNLSPARRNRLILVAALTLTVVLTLWVARGALFPYIVALVLAYLMLPLVNLLERLFLRRVKAGARWPRRVAILLVYLLSIGLVVGFFVLVVPVVGEQFEVLWASRDDLITGAERLGRNLLAWYEENIPPNFQAQVEEALQQASGAVARAVQTGITRTFSVVTGTVSFLIGFFVVPFWLFYVLQDQAEVTRRVFSLAPSRMRADLMNIVRILDNILSAYLRGQLLLCVFIGVMVTVSLSLLGVRFAALLGLIAGVFEILPFIGPFIGLVPAVLVATIQSPLLGLWTLIVFLAIQQLENVVLVPRISGKAVELHPALIMLVIVIGNQLAGLWGMLLAVPVTAMFRDVFKYLYLRLKDEPVSPKEAMAQLGRTPFQLDV